jgi:hypothetical protein
MIKELVTILNTQEFYKGSDNIEFAKGAYRCPRTFKEKIKQYYRWLLRKL